MAWQVSGYDYTYAAHRGAPSRNEISIPPNACGNLKTNKTSGEAPRRNVMESKHTEAARPKGCGLGGGLHQENFSLLGGSFCRYFNEKT